MLGDYKQQTTSAEDIFICIFYLGALRVKEESTTLQNLTIFGGKCDLSDLKIPLFFSFTGPYIGITGR